MATLYYAAYLATDPDPTAGADLVPGSAWATSYAKSLADEIAPASTTTDYVGPELTGLTPSTSYKLAAVYEDGGVYQSLVTAGPFSTLGTDALLADDLEALSELGTPALSTEGTDALTADDLETLSELDTPAVGQTHALIAVDVEALVEFGSVRLDAPLTEAPSSRTFVIPAQDRTIAIGAQNRTIDIPESPRC